MVSKPKIFWSALVLSSLLFVPLLNVADAQEKPKEFQQPKTGNTQQPKPSPPQFGVRPSQGSTGPAGSRSPHVWTDSPRSEGSSSGSSYISTTWDSRGAKSLSFMNRNLTLKTPKKKEYDLFLILDAKSDELHDENHKDGKIWIFVGKVTNPTQQQTFQYEIPYSVYRSIVSKTSHRIAEVELLEADHHESQVYQKNSRPKFFLGGDFDHDCRYPVLVSDYNNTLDHKDDCTRKVLDEFLLEYGVTVFVASTMGTGAKSSVENLGLKSENQFLVLDSSGGGFSGGYGSYGSGDSGKSSEIAKVLFPTGACILGMVGDTPDKDGEAAKALGIPYYAVHQQDRPDYKMVEVVEKSCKLKYPQSFYASSQKLSACPSVGYKSEEVTIIECKSRVTNNFNVQPNWWVELKSKQSPESACKFKNGLNVDGVPTGAMGKDYKCNTNLPMQTKLPEGQTACQPSEIYELKSETRMENQKVGTIPSIDISKYPPGSFYAKNWCEIVPELEKVILNRRNLSVSDSVSEKAPGATDTVLEPVESPKKQ